MNTVLPARDSPVTPSRTVGLNRWPLNSAKARAASRVCSMKSETAELTAVNDPEAVVPRAACRRCGPAGRTAQGRVCRAVCTQKRAARPLDPQNCVGRGPSGHLLIADRRARGNLLPRRACAAPARAGRPAAARASRARSPRRRSRKRPEFSIHAVLVSRFTLSLKNNPANAPRPGALNSGARAGPPFPFSIPLARGDGAPGGATGGSPPVGEPKSGVRRAPRQVPCYQGLPLSGALAQ